MKKYTTAILALVGLSVTALLLIVIVSSIKGTQQMVSASTLHTEQEINKAEFSSQQEIPLIIEQSDNTPFRILDARADVISAEDYERLTGQRPPFADILTKPKMLLQNVSDKTITGVTVMVVDKAAATKFGLYIKEQNIKPGQRFVITPENFAQVSENPARNPRFWMPVRDKSKIAVRIVAFFQDGSLWANN